MQTEHRTVGARSRRRLVSSLGTVSPPVEIRDMTTRMSIRGRTTPVYKKPAVRSIRYANKYLRAIGDVCLLGVETCHFSCGIVMAYGAYAHPRYVCVPLGPRMVEYELILRSDGTIQYQKVSLDQIGGYYHVGPVAILATDPA